MILQAECIPEDFVVRGLVPKVKAEIVFRGVVDACERCNTNLNAHLGAKYDSRVGVEACGLFTIKFGAKLKTKATRKWRPVDFVVRK